jgi:hypothetical protein
MCWAFAGQIRFNLTSSFDPDRPQPDRFLVTLNERAHGYISFATSAWRSDGVQPISVSVRGARYESMVLMSATDWIETDLGRWILSADGRRIELETGTSERIA